MESGGILEIGGTKKFLDVFDKQLAAAQREQKRREQEFPEITKLATWVNQINERYRQVFNTPITPTATSPEEKTRQGAFIGSVVECHDILKPSTPLERNCTYDFILLYYLVIGGGLDKLYYDFHSDLADGKIDYQNLCTSTPLSKKLIFKLLTLKDRHLKHVKIPPLDRWENELLEHEVKALLADRLIATCHKKNKEDYLASHFPDGPTIGFEFEFVDRGKHIPEKLGEVYMNIGDLQWKIDNGQATPKDEEQLKIQLQIKQIYEWIFSMTTNTNTSALMKETQASRLYSANYSGKRPMPFHKAQFRVVHKKLEENRFGHSKTTEDKSSMFSQVNLGLMEDPFGNLDMMPLKDEVQYHLERTTSPSSSVKLSLREFVYARLSKIMVGDLGLHQTIGGIELTPCNYFMEVMALLHGAGYLDDQSESDEKARLAHHELYIKTSYDAYYNNYYYPHHRVRSELGISYPFKNHTGKGIEMRLPSLTRDFFPNFVRQAVFSWLAAFGEQAASKPEEKRTPQEQDLADSWGTLMADWKAFLSKYSIHQPASEEKCIKAVNMSIKELDVKALPYNLYLATTRYNSRINPDFRRECREIITRYNRRVKKLSDIKK